MTAAEFPVLKLRAGGPSLHSVTELTLDGVDLLPFGVTHIELRGGSDATTTASITFEVTLDVETPVAAPPNPGLASRRFGA